MDLATLGLKVDSSQLRRSQADLDAFERKAKSVSKTSEGIGQSFKSASLQMAGFLAGSVGVGRVAGTLADFGQSMADVQAITRAGADDMAAMRSQAKDLGSTTEFSASQAAGALGFLGMAGLNAQQAMAALPQTVNLATIAKMDLASAADVATNVMSGFALEVDDLSRVMDVMARTSTIANTDVRQLGEAFTAGAGPAARMAGVSIEKAAAAVGVLSDAGIQGSRAGTALNAVFTKLQAPTKAALDELSRFGLTAEDIDITTHGLIPVLDTLAAANLDTAAAAALVGLEHAKALDVLLVGSDKMKRYADETENAAGASEAMAKIMRDTLRGSFKGFGSAVEGLIIELGDKGLTGGIRSVVDAFTDLVRGITKMPDLGPVAMGFGLVSAAVIAMTSPLIAATAAIAGIVTGIAYLHQNWDTFASAFPALAGMISQGVIGVRNALAYIGERAGEAMQALNDVFSGNGTETLKLYLRALALDAKAAGARIAAGFIESGAKIKDAVTNWFAGIDFEQASIDGLTVIVDQFERLTGFKIADENQIVSFVTKVAVAVNNIHDGAGAALAGLGDAVSGFLAAFDGAEVNEQLMRNLIGGLTALNDAAQGIGALAGVYIGNLSDDLRALFDLFSNGESSPEEFGNWVGSLAVDTILAVGDAFEFLAHGLNILVQAVNGFASGDWEGFSNDLKEFSQFLKDDIWKSGGGREDAFGAADAISASLETISNTESLTINLVAAKAALENYRDGLVSLEELKAEIATLQGSSSAGFLDRLVGASTAVEDSTLGKISFFLEQIGTEGPKALSTLGGVTSAGQEAAQSVGDIAERAANAKADVDAVEASLKGIGSAADQAKQNVAGIEASVAPVGQAVSAMVSTANTEIDGFTSSLSAKGTAAVNGLASGISGGAGLVTSAIGSVTQAALEALAGFASDMEQAGQQAMAGLADGIVAGAASAAEAAAEAARGVMSATREALDIRSPSRRMARLGEQAMEGLKVGIEARRAEVTELAGQAGSDIIMATEDGLTGASGADWLLDKADNWNLAADTLRTLAAERTKAADAAQAEAHATDAATKEIVANTAATQATTVATGRAAQASAAAASNKLKEVAAGQSAIQNLIHQTEREKALIGLSGKAREELLARWRVEDALNADKLRWNEQQKQGLIDQITLTKELTAEAQRASQAKQAGLNGFLDPIFNGLKNGDLSNVGSQILGNARNMFLDGAKNWLTTGKGGFLGLGSAFKSLTGGGGLGGIIGGAMPIIGAISTVISFFKTTTRVLDQGMQLTVSGTDTLLQSYKKVEKSRFFGLSKKVSTTFETITGETADKLQFAVSQIQDAAIASAAAIGIGADAFEGFSWRAKVSGGSAEQLEGMLEGMANSFAGLGLKGFDVIRAGEGAKDALEALAASLTSANAAFDMMGLRLMDISVMSADAARNLTDLFGGVDEFNSAAGFYWENFYSEAERMQHSVDSLTQTLADAGINVVPQTVAQYRELVQAFSDAGAFQIVGKLIQAAPYFVDGVQALAEVATDGISDLYRDVSRLIDVNIRNIDRALSRLDRAGDDTAMAFGMALMKARAGVMDADVLDAVSSIDASMFGSAAAYRHAENSARAALENLKAGQEGRQSELDAMVSSVLTLSTPLTSIDEGMTLLNSQIAELLAAQADATSGIGDAGTVAEAIATAERQAMIEQLQDQLAEAVAVPKPTEPTYLAYGTKTTPVFGSEEDRENGIIMSDSQVDKINGQRREDYQKLVAERESAINVLRQQLEAMDVVPAYAVGTDFHPGGRALVHRNEIIDLPRGSRVHPARYTPQLNRGNEDLIAEIRALRAENVRLQEDNREYMRRIAKRTEDLFRLEESRQIIPQKVEVTP